MAPAQRSPFAVQSAPRSRLLRLGLCLVFLLLLAGPWLLRLSGTRPGENLGEKRRLKAAPQLGSLPLPEFLQTWGEHFDDTFAGRGLLVRTFNAVTVFGLQTSWVPRTLVGRGGWLFLDRENNKRSEVNYYRAGNLFTPAQLEQWRSALESRRIWLARRGVRFLLVFTANKSSIYPEYLPGRVRRAGGPNRLDQLLETLRNGSGVEVLDLRPVLIGAKGPLPLYEKTDTHWNDLGALRADQALVQRLRLHFPAIRPFADEEFTRHWRPTEGGDLAQTLSLQDTLLREVSLRLTPVAPFTAHQLEPMRRMPGFSFVRTSTWGQKDSRLPRVVMVHDSFYHRWRPFLSEHFAEITYIWDWGFGLFPEVVEREKPDLFIAQLTERVLLDLKISAPPADPPQ